MPDLVLLLQQLALTLLMAALPVLIIAVIAALIIFVRAKWKEIKASLTEQQLTVVNWIVDWAVKQVEQEDVKQLITRTKEEMRDAALLAIHNMLEAFHLDLFIDNEDALITMLEAALREGVHKGLDTQGADPGGGDLSNANELTDNPEAALVFPSS